MPILGTTESTATTIVVAPSITVATAGEYFLEFYSPGVQLPAIAGAHFFIEVFEGATPIAIIADYQSPTATATVNGPVMVRLPMTITAGVHVYRVAAWAPSGTAGAEVWAGPGGPGNFGNGYARVVPS